MEAPTKTFFLIAVHRGHPDFHESTPIVWCGYDGKARSHIWKKGNEGMTQGIRFLRKEDAVNAGVSGPNYQQVDCNTLVDRGILVLQCEDDGVEELKNTETAQ